MSNFSNKDLIVFDLDGTLAESKQPVDKAMAGLLRKLLLEKKVAIISGGSFPQFQKQFLPALAAAEKDAPSGSFSNLFLLPTSGSGMYVFNDGAWKKEYSHDLSPAEKECIISAFHAALEKAGEKIPKKTYGEVFEDRGSQITFSANGQESPVPVKAEWDPTEKRRLLIASFLAPLLPDFSIGIGGMNSIDIVKKGFDKAFGVRQLGEHLKIPIERMLYVGDALYPGGNDYAARASGVECVEVASVNDTKRLIQEIIGKDR